MERREVKHEKTFHLPLEHPAKKKKNIYIIDNERLMMLSEQLKVLYKHLEVALYPSNLVAIILSPTIVGDINPISVTKLVMYFGST